MLNQGLELKKTIHGINTIIFTLTVYTISMTEYIVYGDVLVKLVGIFGLLYKSYEIQVCHLHFLQIPSSQHVFKSHRRRTDLNYSSDNAYVCTSVILLRCIFRTNTG